MRTGTLVWTVSPVTKVEILISNARERLNRAAISVAHYERLGIQVHPWVLATREKAIKDLNWALMLQEAEKA